MPREMEGARSPIRASTDWVSGKSTQIASDENSLPSVSEQREYIGRQFNRLR